MKLYLFVIMTMGLMFTFYIAGIETGSSKIVDFFGFSNTEDNVNLNPSVTGEEVGTINTLRNYISSNSFYFTLIAFFMVIGILSLAKVSALSFSWNPSTEGAFAVFAIAIWGIFAVDVYSIIKFVGEITSQTGWAYNLIRIFLSVYLVAFGLSLITFLKQGE